MARWYERVRGIVLRDAEPASRAYRFMARLIEREFPRNGRGACLALASPDSDRLGADALLMLAYCLRSELDSRVLLVDTRLKARAEGLTGRLDLLGATGFAEVLSGGLGARDDWFLATRVERVDVLPAGDPADRGAVSMDRARLTELLAAARDRYDHVLLQLGSPVRDTRVIMPALEADAVFLLAEENRTFMKGLDDCRKVLRDNGVADVRVVVTGRP